MSQSEALRDGIEVTRRRMDETLAAFEERLKPRRLLDDFLGYLRRSSGAEGGDSLTGGRAVAARVFAAAKANPIPVSLITVGVAWMAIRFFREQEAAKTTSAPGPSDEATGTENAAQLIALRERFEELRAQAASFGVHAPAPSFWRRATKDQAFEIALGCVAGGVAAGLFATALVRQSAERKRAGERASEIEPESPMVEPAPPLPV